MPIHQSWQVTLTVTSGMEEQHFCRQRAQGETVIVSQYNTIRSKVLLRCSKGLGREVSPLVVGERDEYKASRGKVPLPSE